MLIPYGEAGWREKTRLIDSLLAARSKPPFLYNDVLLLTSTARLRRTYGRLILDRARALHNTAAVSPPDIQTVHQFLQRLHTLSGAPPLIDENSRLVLVEGIVKAWLTERPADDRLPDLLAPSVAAAAADMIEQLAAAGIAPERLSAVIADSDFSDKQQLRLLDHAYRRYLEALEATGVSDPATALERLAERFDPAWLGAYRKVIVDGVHDATDLQARVLRQLGRHEDCLFLLDAPSADLVRDAGEQHPLRLLREFAGRLGLLLGDGRPAGGDDGRFLAQALFCERSFKEAAGAAPASFGRKIDVLAAASMREEVTVIAARVKDSLRSGTMPDSVLVAFPSLDEYGPLVEEVFRDYGIPYNRALGRQLSSSPVATALVSLFQAVQEDASGTSLLRIFSSPFLRYGGDRSLAPAFERLMREERIMDGRERWLRASRNAEALAAPVQELFAALDPFFSPGALPLAQWMDQCGALLAWSGVADRVALIKGPLNMNLQAFRMLTAALASLAGAGRLFPQYRYTFSEWFFLLKKTLMRSRYQVPPDDEGGVQVLGLEESASHAWSEVHLGGLVEGSFPQRLAQNIFLPEATLEALGVRTLEKARLSAAYHFYRLVQSAPVVTLAWPESKADKAMSRSPFLAELRPLELANLLNRGTGMQDAAVQFSLRPGDARSVPELAKALAVSGVPAGADAVLRADLGGMPALRAACERRPAAAPAPMPRSDLRTFAVTVLDDYLRCPYRYYVEHVLGIAPVEEVTEDISARDRGSRVHGILRRFYEEWRGPVTVADRGRAHDLLAALTDAAYGRDADTFRNRREREFFTATIAERFLDAETAFWTQGFRPVCLEQRIDDFRLLLEDGTPVLLQAKIDRIDADERGDFIIVDYKTGKYPQSVGGVEQRIFQLPVYAAMAKTALAGTRPALTRPVGLAYYDLAGKFNGPARDMVLYDREAGHEHTAVKPNTSPKSSEDFARILEQALEKARRAAASIINGDYPHRPASEQDCRLCPAAVMCQEEQERQDAGPES